jgi:hypothetical protein
MPWFEQEHEGHVPPWQRRTENVRTGAKWQVVGPAPVDVPSWALRPDKAPMQGLQEQEMLISGTHSLNVRSCDVFKTLKRGQK